jgi:hypothetical protein
MPRSQKSDTTKVQCLFEQKQRKIKRLGEVSWRWCLRRKTSGPVICSYNRSLKKTLLNFFSSFSAAESCSTSCPTFCSRFWENSCAWRFSIIFFCVLYFRQRVSQYIVFTLPCWPAAAEDAGGSWGTWYAWFVGQTHPLLQVLLDLARTLCQYYCHRLKMWRQKKCSQLRGDIGVLREVLTLSFRKKRTRSSSPKNVQPGDTFEDTAFKPRFEIVKF